VIKRVGVNFCNDEKIPQKNQWKYLNIWKKLNIRLFFWLTGVARQYQ